VQKNVRVLMKVYNGRAGVCFQDSNLLVMLQRSCINLKAVSTE
jgi:hypothetical protein